MYYYVEYLRGWRALRVIGIILGVVILIALMVRLWAFSMHSPEDLGRQLQSSPTAQVATTTLPNGVTRTVIDDPVKHVHAVILRSGNRFAISARMPADSIGRDYHIMGNDVSIDRNQRTGVGTIVADNDISATIPAGIIFAISAVIGLVTATMLAGVLAKENDGHLELAWTKPVTRERLALGMMATDIVTIVVSQIATFIVIVAVMSMFIWPHFYANWLTLPVIGCAFLGPIAWYACLTAFSASMTRGLGLVCGLGWLAALGIPSVATATGFSMLLTSPLWATVHYIFLGLAYIDPIAYISFHGTFSQGGINFRTFAGSVQTSVLGLFLLTIGYVAIAVVQWRRVEA